MRSRRCRSFSIVLVCLAALQCNFPSLANESEKQVDPESEITQPAAKSETVEQQITSESAEKQVASELGEKQVPSNSAQNQIAENPETVDSLTKEIILKGIELGRFNLRYRLEANKESKFRDIRYNLLQQASSSLDLASSCMVTGELGEHIKTPDKVNVNQFRRASQIGEVSACIAGGSSAFELSSNMMRAVKNKLKGYDAHSAVAYVKKTVDAIDVLIDKRQRLIDQFPNDDPLKEQYQIESRVLHQLRAFHVRSFFQHLGNMSQYTTNENVFYGLNTGTNAMSLASSIYSIRALKARGATGTSIIIGMAASSTAMVTPAIAQVAGKLSKHRAVRIAKKTLGDPKFNEAALDQDLAIISKTAPDSKVSMLSERIGMYAVSGRRLDKLIASQTEVLNKFDDVAVQNILLAPVIGGANLSAGILQNFAYYHYTPARNKRNPRNEVRSIKVNHAAAIIGLSSNAFTVISNGTLMALNFITSRKMKKEEQTPEMLIKQQLSYLDDLEHKVRRRPAM